MTHMYARDNRAFIHLEYFIFLRWTVALQTDKLVKKF